jgi:hypothetical protein
MGRERQRNGNRRELAQTADRLAERLGGFCGSLARSLLRSSLARNRSAFGLTKKVGFAYNFPARYARGKRSKLRNKKVSSKDDVFFCGQVAAYRYKSVT